MFWKNKKEEPKGDLRYETERKAKKDIWQDAFDVACNIKTIFDRLMDGVTSNDQFKERLELFKETQPQLYKKYKEEIDLEIKKRKLEHSKEMINVAEAASEQAVQNIERLAKISEKQKLLGKNDN
jgi:transketolase